MKGYDQWKTASDEEHPCEVCGVADCECPICPSCGEQGNPVCYAEAGIFGGCRHDFAWQKAVKLSITVPVANSEGLNKMSRTIQIRSTS